MSSSKILMVPGLSGSGPHHWQTLWEATIPSAIRVEQDDWDRPSEPDWIDRLDGYVAEHGPDAVLVGHSLGSIAIVRWAMRSQRTVRGAMLVAPSDVDDPKVRSDLPGWAPIPMEMLPFASVVVASSDDPWVYGVRARAFAKAWGSEFVDAGPIGHINAESNIGAWPQGRALLESVLEEF